MMVESNIDSDLPTVLIVSTPATSGSKEKLLGAFKLKQGDSVDLTTDVWQLVTNYYKADVKFEALELPLVAAHMLTSTSDEENNPWNTLFEEKNIQSIIYYIEDA